MPTAIKPPKPPTQPKVKPGWAHNKFEPTNVPCLYRRNGAKGIVHYGRVKRHGRIYLQKLAVEFKEAKKRLRLWLNGIEQKSAVAASADEGTTSLVTWGDFKDRYLRAIDLDVGLADKTKSYRRECVNRITKTWEGIFQEDVQTRKIAKITQDQCATWAASITGFHTTTYNNTIATFKHIFQEAIEIGHLLASPAQRLKRIGKLHHVNGCIIGEPGEPLNAQEREALISSEDEETRWYPTPEQFKNIITTMRSYKFGPVQQAANFAELLAYTGCRLSEANRLRWSDVDWQNNRIRVNGAKGRATSSKSAVRHVPITEALADLLKRLEGVSPNRQPGDKIAKVSECRGTMQRACMDLKLPRKLDHHDLRHWFSTRAVACGVPVPVVSDWLGHRDGGALLLSTYRHEDKGVSQEWVKHVKM